MKYYVNEGSKIGKVFEAKNDVEAVSFATGYGHAKGWQTINLYCQTTRETVTRQFPAMSIKRWLLASKFIEEFLETDKPLWN